MVQARFPMDHGRFGACLWGNFYVENMWKIWLLFCSRIWTGAAGKHKKWAKFFNFVRGRGESLHHQFSVHVHKHALTHMPMNANNF